MADQELQDITTTLSSPAGEDLLYAVDDPSGTPARAKLPLSGLLAYIEGAITSFALKDLGPNAQTGTTYTLVIGDASQVVTMDNASANTLTIPPNSSVAFAVGECINVIQLGAGATSITGGAGVTLNGVSTGTGAINNQYQGVSLLQIATDTWVASGDIGAVA